MNFKEIATRFVQLREQDHLEQLAHETINAHHRAEGCGCFQCIKASQASQDKFSREDNRINTWSPENE